MRIAFIGGHGHHYLRGALADPACKIEIPAAVAGDGIDDPRAKAFAEKTANTQYFESAEKMLEEYKPDVVSIGTIYGLNGDWVARILERNLPVVSDKPIAATRAQLGKLKSLTADPSRIVLTEFDFRSRPTFNSARQAVMDGKIGEVVLAVAQKSYRYGSRPEWYADRTQYPGTLMWVASHGIDSIVFTTGLRFAAMTGNSGNLLKPGWGKFEDHTVSLFTLTNGGTAVVHADYLRPAKATTHGDDRLRIAGTKGVIEIRDERCRLTTNDAEQIDITDITQPPPIHRELLSAIEGKSDRFNTATSLELAEILLNARDACDAASFKTSS